MNGVRVGSSKDLVTVTDELRHMLDERGVEWWQSANTLGCIFTRWHSPIFGDEVVAMENGEEGLVLFDHFVTPAQAIDATLGRGTCHETIINHHWRGCGSCGYMWEFMYGIGRCQRPNFCPNCGRRIEVDDG